MQKTKQNTRLPRPRIPVRLMLCALVMGWAGTGRVAAQSPDKDIELASGLVDMGFPDYADKLMKQVLMKNPEMEDSTKIVRAQIMLMNGKLEDAKAILDGMPKGSPKAQAIELQLARVYYGRGMGEEARKIYTAFFDQYKGSLPTDTDLLRFYREAAYSYAQMLKDMGDNRGAADAMLCILGTNPEIHTKRKIQAESAQLLLLAAEKMSGADRVTVLEQAKKLCQELQWGGMDIFFGQSISTAAHVELLYGNKDGARSMLEEYMTILRQIDGMLKEEGMPMKESPMAEARFMLGKIYEEDASGAASAGKTDEAIQLFAKALNEYYNVFITYGDSEFGPGAGEKAKEIIERLKRDFNKEVGIKMPEGGASCEAAFRSGDTFFRNRNFGGAIAEYEKALVGCPEAKNSSGAIVNLAQCYAQENDWLMTQVVLEYLGERFAKDEMAPNGHLAVGKIYFDRKDRDKYLYAYNHYVDSFPAHERAPQILYTLAGMFKQEGDMERAGQYYKRLADQYPKDKHSIMAMSNIAGAEYAAKNYAQAIPGFIAYLDTVQPGYDRALAQFSLADSYFKLENYVEAIKAFNTLIGWLKPEDSPYNNSADAKTKNRGIYEKACFFRAFCCAVIKKPETIVPKLREMGVAYFDEFVKEFPGSELAPKAMARKGGIQLELKRHAEAVKTFNDLAAAYPQSPEGENAQFSLVRAAMEVGMQDIARDALNKMLAAKSSYKPSDFARIGQLMFDAGMFAETIQANQEVLGKTEDRALLERALYGTGKSAFETKQFDLCVQTFSELLERYPKSKFFFESKFLLGQAYHANKQYAEATQALRDVFQYGEDPVMGLQANLLLGEIQLEQGDVDAALASFQRIALLGNTEIPECRPIIEKAILQSIQTAMKASRFDTVEESCRQYEQLFPTSPRIENIRRVRQEARRKAAASG